MTTLRTRLLSTGAIALAGLTASTVAQQVNTRSNTERGGAAMRAQLEGIRAAWIDYWSEVTGGVSTMATDTGRAR
jgi:hypothetical protein